MLRALALANCLILTGCQNLPPPFEIPEQRQPLPPFRAHRVEHVADMAAGEVFTASNLRSIRPGHGLPPRHLTEILGRRACRAIARGTPVSWNLVE